MKILEFNEFSNRESETRTKSLSDEEFLKIFKENCKNFSFDNDQIWRKSNKSFGDFGLFMESDRAGTIGNYSYKDFFDQRGGYLVPRKKSLIGSTSFQGADIFGSGVITHLVIPFDNSNIIFCGAPDLALWSKTGQKISDDLFLLKTYDVNFKVPVTELNSILMNSSLSTYINKIKGYGFEFFTNSNCLILSNSKIDWLKKNI